ncbi:hypothetical protein C2G38_2075139 [Gigaspora rosea]|uniref:Uncharacterized protein n=1 Tax=Gigaspora rosea TaxID=44941 RepID=A0A397VLC2_9GLOM|nr:hypothetical protein C2G38_2075139 [Gigaspora rosea]
MGLFTTNASFALPFCYKKLQSRIIVFLSPFFLINLRYLVIIYILFYHVSVLPW